MTGSQRAFAARAVRNKRLFLALSMAGLAVAALLAGFYGYRRLTEPDYPLGARAVIVLLILLNARQNFRQYRYAGVLEATGAARIPRDAGTAPERERTEGRSR